MKVCVFGASSTQIDPVFKQAAFDLGKAIADKNWSLVFGAGASGIMGASADGAMSIQGEIIGIVPSFFKELHHALHEGCPEMIFTETMRERKGKMEDLADAFIICPGGIGTYEEFFEVYTLKQLQQLDKPICIFNVAGYYNPLIELLNKTVDLHFMSSSCLDLIMVSDSIDEMLAHIAGYVKGHTEVDFMLEAEEE
ncbi:TIGR00730 family Rossman fold protein [Ileibacterium valens]|uniref:LOG family protein n=1 Tax=Ileibacterium valens TaxID=1862668 RepID=UPI00272D4548|nr:TIGR00730 family Rossman fold protein [Ileibacterium valens]